MSTRRHPDPERLAQRLADILNEIKAQDGSSILALEYTRGGPQRIVVGNGDAWLLLDHGRYQVSTAPIEECADDSSHNGHTWSGHGRRCPGRVDTSGTVFGIRPHTGRPEDDGLRKRVAEMLPPERTCLDEVPHGPHTWVAGLTSIHSCPGVSA